jgi:NADPH:quinone reductase-like Zn-dependent oxidoreductase
VFDIPLLNNVRLSLTTFKFGRAIHSRPPHQAKEILMKAAIVTAPGKTPIYADFPDPTPKPDEQIISVQAAALSNLTRGRASGTHYSSAGIYPAVAGTDGVGLTPDGRRVYFAMPEAPYGSLAEFCPIHPRRCVEIPDALDDITAAAIANPGMSAWASLVDRAHLAPGETVLINGATGTAGRVAVQLAKYLGAAKVIVTGRNPSELETLKQLGADQTIAFNLNPDHPNGAADFEQALHQTFAAGIDIVIDYLWGQTALTLLTALAKTIDDHPVRFVQVGSAAGDLSINLPAALLRSSAITLIGSGIGSVSREALAQSIRSTFEACAPAHLTIATQTVPLSEVETIWPTSTGKPRIVFTID